MRKDGQELGQLGGNSDWDVGLAPVVQVEERVKAVGSLPPRRSSDSGGQQRTQRGRLNPTSCVFVANTWVLRFLSFRALDPKEQRCQHFLLEVSARKAAGPATYQHSGLWWFLTSRSLIFLL